ncbi:hypothetical protein C8R47DRAFT_1133692 [Mycena vitilis]|nr:hypothetical protein C8R47DRAFT_1133692 [Mycena vitilis]
MLVVGIATDVVMEPRSYTSGFFRTYKFTEEGGLRLYHTTQVDDIPLAMVAFQAHVPCLWTRGKKHVFSS